MWVTMLDDTTVKWTPKEHRHTTASIGHNASLALLREKWPTVRILQEVSIPIVRNKTLYLDIFIPILNIAVEFHGVQHFKFTPMFHKSKMDFVAGKKNDRNKKEWCELNGITLIEFSYKDSEGDMREKLDEC